MKTIQMTIEENLLSEVDDTIESLNTTRSAFIRHALRLALQEYKSRLLESQHRTGYENHPVLAGEFDGWEAEQFWGSA
jgi:metal-responsive CopG/Arc/MetJ family transcriptional regulator